AFCVFLSIKDSMASAISLPETYWADIQINRQDVESLQTHLFEVETPLTTHDLASVFVGARIKTELAAQSRERQGSGRTYLPKEKYNPGDELVFPAMNWKRGRVTASRLGANPEADTFEVITVAMEDGSER